MSLKGTVINVVVKCSLLIQYCITFCMSNRQSKTFTHWIQFITVFIYCVHILVYIHYIYIDTLFPQSQLLCSKYLILKCFSIVLALENKLKCRFRYIIIFFFACWVLKTFRNIVKLQKKAKSINSFIWIINHFKYALHTLCSALDILLIVACTVCCRRLLGTWFLEPGEENISWHYEFTYPMTKLSCSNSNMFHTAVITPYLF